MSAVRPKDGTSYDGTAARNTKGICVPPDLANVCATPTTITYQYDADGDRVQITDENGSVVTNHFDAVRRVVSKGINRGTNIVGTTSHSYQYDGLSRLVQGTDDNDPLDAAGASTITRAYDSLGHVIEETEQTPSTPLVAISSSWEGDNRRTSLIYPNGRSITNTFDRLNRLQSIADAGTNTPIAAYSYIGRRRTAERSYPLNNTRLTYLDGLDDVGYDGLGRAVQLRNLSGTTNLLVGYGHTYNRRNHPLSETKLHALNDSELYHLDSQNRLVQFGKGTLNSNSTSIATPTLHLALQTNWTFDGLGNWERVNNETRLHNSFNEIVQRSNSVGVTVIASDRNGNETDNGTLIFQYDYRNRLRKVSRKSDGALLAAYFYDARNRRISKVVTNSGALNGTTRYYSSGLRELEERNETNGLVQQYVYGRYIDEPLVLDRNLNGDSSANGSGDQRLFYHANRLHSITGLTDTTGKVVEGYEYDAYGMRTVFSPGTNGVVDFGADDLITIGGGSTLRNDYGYTGRRLDGESGLYYYRNRYLSPDEGRFTSRDPIEYRARRLGLHEYAGGAPSSRKDPLGTDDSSNFKCYEFVTGEGATIQCFSSNNGSAESEFGPILAVVTGGTSTEISGFKDALEAVWDSLEGELGPIVDYGVQLLIDAAADKAVETLDESMRGEAPEGEDQIIEPIEPVPDEEIPNDGTTPEPNPDGAPSGFDNGGGPTDPGIWSPSGDETGGVGMPDPGGSGGGGPAGMPDPGDSGGGGSAGTPDPGGSDDGGDSGLPGKDSMPTPDGSGGSGPASLSGLFGARAGFGARNNFSAGGLLNVRGGQRFGATATFGGGQQLRGTAGSPR